MPWKGKKNLGHEAVRIFWGLNSSSPLLTDFFEKKLRSGPSTESFLASGDLEYQSFLTVS